MGVTDSKGEKGVFNVYKGVQVTFKPELNIWDDSVNCYLSIDYHEPRQDPLSGMNYPMSLKLDTACQVLNGDKVFFRFPGIKQKGLARDDNLFLEIRLSWGQSNRRYPLISKVKLDENNYLQIYPDFGFLWLLKRNHADLWRQSKENPEVFLKEYLKEFGMEFSAESRLIQYGQKFLIINSQKQNELFMQIMGPLDQNLKGYKLETMLYEESDFVKDFSVHSIFEHHIIYSRTYGENLMDYGMEEDFGIKLYCYSQVDPSGAPGEIRMDFEQGEIATRDVKLIDELYNSTKSYKGEIHQKFNFDTFYKLQLGEEKYLKWKITK